MKLQKGKSGRYNITVPVSIVRVKEWEKGEELNWEINEEGDIVLKERKWLEISVVYSPQLLQGVL